jgi:DNA-binding NarL/FixJ family response regulator
MTTTSYCRNVIHCVVTHFFKAAMIPTVYYIGFEKNASVLEAICLERFKFFHTKNAQEKSILRLAEKHRNVIEIIDACYLEPALMCYLLKHLTIASNVISILIATTDNSLAKINQLQLSFKVTGMIDLVRFEPRELVEALKSAKGNVRCFEKILAMHPILSPKIKEHISSLPKLENNEFQDMLTLLQVNNISEYARQQGVARSTVHRRLNKILEKLNLTHFDEIKRMAIQQQWV